MPHSGALVALLCLLLAPAAGAKTYTRASFPVTGDGVNDSNMMVNQGALGLAVQRYLTVKVYGDSTLAPLRTTVSYCPDVIATADSTFSTFWTDGTALYRRDYQIRINQAVPLQTPLSIATAVIPAACYLHADKGDNGYLASYVVRSGMRYILELHNGTRRFDIDSVGNSFLYASQCHAAMDTFCVVCIDSLDTMRLRKVYSSGGDIHVVSSTIATTGRAVILESLLNPSVAVEPGGAVLVAWEKGSITGAKDLYYRVYDASLTPVTGETLLATGVSPTADNTMDYYNNTSVVAYGAGRFALVYWDATGLMLNRLQVNGAAVTVASNRIITRPSLRSPALAFRSQYLIVACSGDVDNNGRKGVEGYRYPMQAGEPDLASGEFFRYSNPAVTDSVADHSNVALNIAIDSLENVCLVWRWNQNAQCCIWAARPVRYRRGFWTSPVESLSVTTGDSVRYYPGRVTISDLSSWYLEDSLRTGCSPADFNEDNPWISLSSDAALGAARTNCRYFQFRLTLNRKITAGADSLITPGITAFAMQWNAKPVTVAVDSLTVNGTVKPNFHFDSTVTVISRKDSLVGYFSLHDADSAGRLTMRTRWPARDSLRDLASSPSVNTTVRFYRLQKSDTSVVCTVTVVDTFGWQAVPKKFRIVSRNSAPQLIVSAVYRAPDGSLDTAALTSFRRFSVQEDDSIAFIYSVADTNDSATVRAYFRRTAGGPADTLDSLTAGGQEKRTVLAGSAIPAADSALMEFIARDVDTTLLRRASVVVNHLPHITAATFDGKTVHAGDTVRVYIGKQIAATVNARDTDLAYWDTMRCSLSMRSRADSSINRTGSFSFSLMPDRNDTGVTVAVQDIFGRTDTLRFYCVVINHPPHITAVRIDGATVRAGDSVRVMIGKQVAVTVTAVDTDLVNRDTLHCLLSTRAKADSSSNRTGDFTFLLLPARADSLVTLAVRDIYGGKDSLRFYCKYPWLALDSLENPGYVRAADSLDTVFSLIIGGRGDSIAVPLLNGGHDTMYLNTLRLDAGSGRWLSVVAPQGSGPVTFTDNNQSSFIPLLMRPGTATGLIVRVSADSLHGDGVIRARIIISTSDFAHPYDTLPVRLEYNDLPVVLAVAPDWDSTQPYVPLSALSKKRAAAVYKFPPHAAIGITFSEPMDSASALRGVTVYSVFDSAAAGGIRPIRLQYTWNSAYTRLTVSARYTAESPYFHFTPPQGLFVPTDSLTMVLTPGLTDRARTPSGPNRLDINHDFRRDTSGDTAFHFRVDSITFTVMSVSPANSDTTVSRTAAVEVTFSAPVLLSSVDISKTGNRSLILRSRYSGGGQINYDSVTVHGNVVRFYPAGHFFYRDSVACYYRSASVLDRMGFPSDNTGDGIPATLIDTAATAEDLSWSFRVKNISVLSVTPAKGDSVSSASMPIVITFSDRVPAGTFDTTLTYDNKSFRLLSLYGGANQSRYRSISLSPDSMRVTVVPTFGYFSNDSLQARFTGFSSGFRYGAANNYPSDTAGAFSGYAWYFKTGKTGFYTFPNPYKPGKDPRHCQNGGPCGIWFKNIHTLAAGTLDFRIGIYSTMALPVYETKKAGADIHFNPGDEPQWLWNTKNQQGELVASGIYFYVIYDRKDKALAKGKVMIIR